MISFEGRLVWITGASSGIGRAMALELAKEGARLILSSNNKEELERVVIECQNLASYCESIPFDLANPSEVQLVAANVAEKYKHIYLLVNNGGISQRSLAADTPIELDRKIMEIDYFSYVILTKTLIPGMIKAREGYIAATSSISGKFGFPLRSAYSAAKHAIQGFFETLRIELKPYNISVTVAYPGRVRTNISLNALDNQGNTHGIMDAGQANAMSAEQCAKEYIHAIKRRMPEVLIGRKELLMVHLKRFVPSLFFKIVGRINPT